MSDEVELTELLPTSIPDLADLFSQHLFDMIHCVVNPESTVEDERVCVENLSVDVQAVLELMLFCPPTPENTEQRDWKIDFKHIQVGLSLEDVPFFESLPAGDMIETSGDRATWTQLKSTVLNAVSAEAAVALFHHRHPSSMLSKFEMLSVKEVKHAS